MVKKSTRPSNKQVFSLAHSAQCKLGMSAGDTDRNLRFILGHSFLLDKTLLRVAEIEGLDEVNEPESAKGALADDDTDRLADENEAPGGQTGSLAGGRVKFDDTDSEGENRKKHRADRKIPPPTSMPDPEVTGSGQTDADHEKPAYSDEELDADDYDADEGGGLSLTRFASASMEPPKMIPPSDSDPDEEDEEPISPPALPTDFDVQAILERPPDVELGELFELVRSCPCNDETTEKCSKVWNVDVPGSDIGKPKKRLAVMELAA